MWDGSRIVSRSGIHYAIVEVTKHVYGGGIPSEIGLRAPISIEGVTFSSPSPESFTATILLGVLFINVMFADGTQRNLSAIIFLPPIKDGMPQGCALLVTHGDQQAGFVVVFTPSSEPLDNPALRYETLGKIFQCRIYVIVRANSVSTTNTPLAQSSCTVIAESYLTVHVFDEPCEPIQNALVVINGTYICLDSRLNQSGRTDSNGDATFAVAPHPAAYNVTVILPENYQNRAIVVTNVGTPNPTFHTTIRVGLHQLRASIILLGETCRFVNETAIPTLLFHFECTLEVEYNANDGSHPQVSILWTDGGWGGSFNSTTSQWIQYRSPQGIECLNVTVTVFAPGYESGSDTLGMIDMVVPDPSGGYVHNCPWDRSTTTATTVVPSGPVPGFPVESIIMGLALGVVLILFRAKSCTRKKEDLFRSSGESVRLD